MILSDLCNFINIKFRLNESRIILKFLVTGRNLLLALPPYRILKFNIILTPKWTPRYQISDKVACYFKYN